MEKNPVRTTTSPRAVFRRGICHLSNDQGWCAHHARLTVTSADFVRFLGRFRCLLPEVRRPSSVVSATILKESPGFVCFMSPNQQSAVIDPLATRDCVCQPSPE